MRVAFMLAIAAAHEPGHGNNPEASVPYAAVLVAVWTILYIASFGVPWAARTAARSTSV